PASCLNGILSAVNVAKIKRSDISSPHWNQPVGKAIGKGGGCLQTTQYRIGRIIVIEPRKQKSSDLTAEL
ncbi:hypothetical protein, partial [Pectobacterium brasiliense]|uniref:hypothetical protein n=1 Tax=Pectobacterium brasiliense TaxID=180957 RepID=UPI001C5E5623